MTIGCSKLRKNECMNSAACSWIVGQGCKRKQVDHAKPKSISIENRFLQMLKHLVQAYPTNQRNYSLYIEVQLNDETSYEIWAYIGPNNSWKGIHVVEGPGMLEADMSFVTPIALDNPKDPAPIFTGVIKRILGKLLAKRGVYIVSWSFKGAKAYTAYADIPGTIQKDAKLKAAYEKNLQKFWYILDFVGFK